MYLKTIKTTIKLYNVIIRLIFVYIFINGIETRSRKILEGTKGEN